MRNYLIKLLGGHSHEDYTALQERYNAIPAVWTAAVEALLEQERATIVTGPAQLVQPHIDGALIIAPRSGAFVTNSYSESSYFPVDSEKRIH